MNLSLTGCHVAITRAIRDYLSNKIFRVLRRFDHVIDIGVILTVEKLSQKAEAKVHIRGRDIVETCGANMHASIDSFMDKLDRQILRHKKKNANHRGNGALKNLEMEQANSDQPHLELRRERTG